MKLSLSSLHSFVKCPRTPFVAFVCVTLAACGSPGAPDDAAEGRASMTVTVGTPAERKIPLEIVASGSIAAWQEMSLGVELSGVRVEQVLVEVGDRVKAGAPLVRLDKRTLEVEARQADASVAQARANLDLAQTSGTRGESLLGQKLISESDAEELRANLSRAEAQLAASVAERDAARLDLEFSTLRSPDAGVISSRSVQPGQIISVGNELLRLIRQGRLEWRAQISEGDLARVRIGSRVELMAPDGELVVGKVRAISPAVDPDTRTALIYADLPQPGSLRAGMFAEGRLVLGETTGMVVPRDAVVVRDGYSYVFVLGEDSQVSQRRVKVGVRQPDVVEIREGLEPTDRFVVRGAGFLSDGDLVRVTEGE